MMEFVDLALDYLKDHKILAASVLILFLFLLVRNFWFLIKFLLILALGVIAVTLVLSFIGRASKGKKDLLKPDDSSYIERARPFIAESYHQTNHDRLKVIVLRGQHQFS